MIFERTPPAVEDRQQCNACGMWIDPVITPRGGRFSPKDATLTALDGTVVTYPSPTTGWCPFCHSPAWADGGSLGDFQGWHSRR